MLVIFQIRMWNVVHVVLSGPMIVHPDLEENC